MEGELSEEEVVSSDEVLSADEDSDAEDEEAEESPTPEPKAKSGAFFVRFRYKKLYLTSVCKQKH